MFWNKFDSLLAKESSVQDVLANTDWKNVTLTSLLDKEDCIQETKARNPLLMRVLTRADILLELVRLTSSDPPGDIASKQRFRDATISCELLNADAPEITDALIQTPDSLDALFDIFDSSEALSPILTSFVTRTLGLLVARRPTEMLEYLSRKDNFLDNCLRHLNITAVTDLFIRLITAHDNDVFRYKICEWLNGQSFLEKAAAYLDASKTTDHDYHANSAQLICDIIRFSREQQLQQLKPDDNINLLTPETYANDLLKTADSESFIGLIVSNLIRSAASQSAIVQCLMVLQAPFEFIPVNFDGNSEQKALFSELSLRVINSRIERYSRVLSPVVPQLRDVLIDPPFSNCLISELMNDGVGPVRRVGQVRMQMIRLVTLLVSFGRSQLNRAFYESGMVLTALDMFFDFHWNSFFHAQVQNCTSLILRHTPIVPSVPPNVLSDHPLLHQMIIDGQIYRRIMDAWKNNEETERSGKPRRPYMGHLLVMAVELSSDQTPSYSLVQILLSGLDGDLVQEWRNFVTNSIRPLVDIQSRCLGGGVHPLQQSLSVMHGVVPSIPSVKTAATVAAFEYDSASVPAIGDEGLVVLVHDRPDGVVKRPAQTLHDTIPDEEMRVRQVDDDEEDEDEDDDMQCDAVTPAQMQRLAELATPKIKIPFPDWPVTQPLNISEKAGIERLEEADNANSPWDAAMKMVDGSKPHSSEFPWKSDAAVSDSDSWADFSNFPSLSCSTEIPLPGSAFFPSSSSLRSMPSNSDSEGDPFEFQAPSSPKTPEPLDIIDVIMQEAGSGDIQMKDTLGAADSCVAPSSDFVGTIQGPPDAELPVKNIQIDDIFPELK